MSKRTELLNDLARQALDQYGKDLEAGGEPIYPQWAKEMQSVAREHTSLVNALTLLAQKVDATWPLGFGDELKHARAALAAAEA